MKVRLLGRATLLVAGFSLSACLSGGSSGSSGSGADTVTLPRDGALELDGTAVVAEFSNNGIDVDVDGVNAPQDSSLRLTTEDGEIVAARVTAPGSNLALDSRDGDTLDQDAPLIGFESSDANEVIVFVDPTESTLEHQTFGVWLNGATASSGTAGVGSYGVRTAASDVPSSGEATYEGISTGFARLDDGNAYVTASEIRVSTNFSTATINSTGTVVGSLDDGEERSASELNFAGTGNVSGNSFAASVSGEDVTGTANGIFYGPNAAEVGGTFRTEGTGITYIGSFGAN
ncbi:transferrin-binding protein-like solute binding protein [Ruegeria arenilitoris]|uniref:transferrin-binding protein-like solute binding protein n=2 Tax=Ruegeria arenilitoris TaxID=1173585 RepID=UPI00147CE000|nr:transferrin-binding protein-like solute binding protein [Ruegeria arenilitoris]